MNQQSVISILIFVVFSILFTGCLPTEKEDKLLGGWSSSTDNTLAQSFFDDLNNVVTRETQQRDQIYDVREHTETPGEVRTNSCADVTLDFTQNTIFPATLTIDFGNGCTGDDGRLRTGVVTTVFSGPYQSAGTTITSTLQNYSVDGFKVEGTRILTNNGKNTAGNTTFTAKINNGKITDLAGQDFTWDSEFDYEWVAGEQTNWWTHGLGGVTDDVYLLTGSALGTTRDDIDYTSTIDLPIRVELTCKWPVSGKFTVSPDGFVDRSVDYGTGACDREVKLTVGTFAVDINLP